ncbi:MAG: GNAT family N-acetyltransferase [Lachnospiraceae bacterium]|nr:GNAT family N-acetyltransferase [Lachnospiraceae bacterium]
MQIENERNMKIRELAKEDLPACAEILCSVYNNDMWQCQWNKETAMEYLTDFFELKKFVGYVLEENGEILGGIFAHEKVWWNNSEVFIEEMFVKPELQRKGYGSMLLNRVEEYSKEKRLAGITLSTNKYAPAPLFYRKNGFRDNEYVILMYKEI